MSDAAEQHPHYYVDVKGLTKVDIYRLVELFNVKPGAIDHAIKKLMVAGQRGHKDAITDVKDSIKSLQRWLEMREEDAALNARTPASQKPAENHAFAWLDRFSALGFTDVKIDHLGPEFRGAVLDGHKTDYETSCQLLDALRGPHDGPRARELMMMGQVLVNVRSSVFMFGHTHPIFPQPPGWYWRPFGVTGAGTWAACSEPRDELGPFFAFASDAYELVKKVRER